MMIQVLVDAHAIIKKYKMNQNQVLSVWFRSGMTIHLIHQQYTRYNNSQALTEKQQNYLEYTEMVKTHVDKIIDDDKTEFVTLDVELDSDLTNLLNDTCKDKYEHKSVMQGILIYAYAEFTQRLIWCKDAKLAQKYMDACCRVVGLGDLECYLNSNMTQRDIEYFAEKRALDARMLMSDTFAKLRNTKNDEWYV